MMIKNRYFFNNGYLVYFVHTNFNLCITRNLCINYWQLFFSSKFYRDLQMISDERRKSIDEFEGENDFLRRESRIPRAGKSRRNSCMFQQKELLLNEKINESDAKPMSVLLPYPKKPSTPAIFRVSESQNHNPNLPRLSNITEECNETKCEEEVEQVPHYRRRSSSLTEMSNFPIETSPGSDSSRESDPFKKRQVLNKPPVATIPGTPPMDRTPSFRGRKRVSAGISKEESRDLPIPSAAPALSAGSFYKELEKYRIEVQNLKKELLLKETECFQLREEKMVLENERDFALEEVNTRNFMISLEEQRSSELEQTISQNRLDHNEKLSRRAKKHKTTVRKLQQEKNEYEEKADQMVQQMTDQMTQLQAMAMKRIEQLEKDLIAQRHAHDHLMQEHRQLKLKQNTSYYTGNKGSRHSMLPDFANSPTFSDGRSSHCSRSDFRSSIDSTRSGSTVVGRHNGSRNHNDDNNDGGEDDILLRSVDTEEQDGGLEEIEDEVQCVNISTNSEGIAEEVEEIVEEPSNVKISQTIAESGHHCNAW